MRIDNIPIYSGVYKIVNTKNDRYYIGQATSFQGRARAWRSMLRSGKSYNKELQADWDKHGEDFFEFKVIEECEKQQLKRTEGRYIRDARGKDNIYNVVTPIMPGNETLDTCTVSLRAQDIVSLDAIMLYHNFEKKKEAFWLILDKEMAEIDKEAK